MSLGISFLLTLKSVSLLAFVLYLRTHNFHLTSLPFLYASIVSLFVAIASHPRVNHPSLLGKKADGTFPFWSAITFSPYFYFVRIFSSLRRSLIGEDPYTMISPGIYVGGWPSSAHKCPPGNPAIVDCTCEFPRKVEFGGFSYVCVPTWDTRSPRPGEIESAVKWVVGMRAQGSPVFIHCAYGHGRSVAVTCAVMVALGIAEDWKMAEKMIKEKRPKISMNSLHRRALEDWSKQ